MKLTSALLLATWLSSAVAGQNYRSGFPNYRSGFPAVDHEIVQVMTFSYPGFTGFVDFLSTVPTPKANGKARIIRLCPITSIDAYVDDLPPASSFGEDFCTYVLWLISPE